MCFKFNILEPEQWHGGVRNSVCFHRGLWQQPPAAPGFVIVLEAVGDLFMLPNVSAWAAAAAIWACCLHQGDVEANASCEEEEAKDELIFTENT